MLASSFFLSLIPFDPRVWKSLKGNFQIPGSPLEDLAVHSQIGIHPPGAGGALRNDPTVPDSSLGGDPKTQLGLH